MPSFVIQPLANEKEASASASFMAESDPWVTLGIGVDDCLATTSDATRERFVAYDNDALVGIIIINMSGGLAGYIQTVCVAPGRRGEGIGAALVAFAEERIFARHANVFLCVSSFNADAQRLYERLGYEVVGRLTDYLVAGHDEILLRKSRGPIRGYVADAPQPVAE